MDTPANRLREPDVGATVTTVDGKECGTVKEIHGAYFKISVHMGRDYWLKRDFIKETTPDRVTLTLHNDAIDEHRLAEPGLEDPMDPEILESAEVLRESEVLKEEVSLDAAKARAGLYQTYR
ncbi:MAG: hypothetical protein WBO97_00570 [Tepidiformaceae bacterium]